MQMPMPASASLKTCTVSFCPLCHRMVTSGEVLRYCSLLEHRDAKVERRD